MKFSSHEGWQDIELKKYNVAHESLILNARQIFGYKIFQGGALPMFIEDLRLITTGYVDKLTSIVY